MQVAIVIKLALFIVYLLAAGVIVGFNLLYHSRALRANALLGLHIPTRITSLKYISIFLSLFTALLLLVLFFVNFY